ncbi:hypothetical protein [Streptomyces geranii]|uniref:hypothetical protein n=1 Tax=Streptomyces geranii TaxID=2058923 RepID=UPI000D03A275|nr:hypothetical protein [Streptomyces geranii]
MKTKLAACSVASVALLVGSRLTLVGAMAADVVDRVLLFFTPVPRKRPARDSTMTLTALTLTALHASRGAGEGNGRNN